MVVWNNFVMEGQVNCSTGPVFKLSSDSKSPDYSVLSIDDLHLKLSQADLQDIMQLINREGFSRITVK